MCWRPRLTSLGSMTLWATSIARPFLLPSPCPPLFTLLPTFPVNIFFFFSPKGAILRPLCPSHPSSKCYLRSSRKVCVRLSIRRASAACLNLGQYSSFSCRHSSFACLFGTTFFFLLSISDNILPICLTTFFFFLPISNNIIL